MGGTVWWQIRFRDTPPEVSFPRRSLIAQTALISICLIAAWLWTGGDQRAFIYFQF